MALQQVPIDIVEKEILAGDLPLSEIFNFCQAQAGTRLWLQRCQSQSFWRQVGESKYPILTKALERGIRTSIGRYYRDLAEFMVVLNTYLQEEDFFGVTFNDIPLDDPRFTSDDEVGEFILGNTLGLEATLANLQISLLRNGRYHVAATTINEYDQEEHHSIYLSPQSFEEFFSTYVLISPAQSVHFNAEPRSEIDVEPFFDRLRENFVVFSDETQ